MRLFVVTGMHRSGTSAVAALTQALGADVGDPGDLLPAAPDNPRGFFELRAFKTINDHLLEALGGTWARPPAMPHGWQDDPELDSLRQRARTLVQELDARGSSVVVLKDPRASLTLPFWRTVHDVAGTIVPMRRPSAVAASLLVRNGTPAAVSARLWWTYTTAALAADPDALLITYGDVVRDTAVVLPRLAAHLGLDMPAEVADVIDAALDHGDDAPVPEDAVLEAAGRFHDLLVGDDDGARGAAIDAALLTDGLPWADRALDLSERLTRARTGLDERDAKLTALNERVAVLRADVERLANDREHLRARVARRELDLRDQRQVLDEARAEGRASLERVQRRFADMELERRREMDRLQARADSLREQLDDAVADRDIARGQRKDVARQLRRTQEQLTSLRSRRGVRVALKLARLAKPVMPNRRTADDATPATPESPADDETPPVLTHEEASVPAPATRRHLTFDPTTADLATTVTVVIPVHDSPDEVRRCLDAVIRNTTSPARLLIVDDASTLASTRALLDEFAGRDGIEVLRNDENLGFTRTVNRGLEACDTDVVILNSDTEVGPRWLEGLRIAVGSDPSIGTATAVSDDAGAFSVPAIGARNDLPGHLGVDAASRALARGAEWVLPRTPTGNGFCMYIRRALLDDVGMLDAEGFPVGYGEENDLCMRAGRAGWHHVVADAVLVRHAKGSSFGDRRERLIDEGRAVVDARYPEYTDQVRAFVGSAEMDRAREAARASLWDCAATTTASGGPSILYVLHEGRGGTPATSLDLGVALSDRYDSLMLTSDTRTLRLSRITTDGLEALWEHDLDEPIDFRDRHRDDIRRLLADLMVVHAVELVHVRHVIKQTFDVFDVARDLGIPYVVSFHDFYLSCPTIHLLDDQDRFCGGTCTPGEGACRIPMGWVAESAPPLKHAGVHEWREFVLPHLEGAAALITTSAQAREVYLRSYPTLDPDTFHLIEHGRDLEWESAGWQPPSPGEPIRVLVPGNLDVHKGSELWRAILAADTAGRIELHLLGEQDSETTFGIPHGPYERDEFADRVRAIRPHLVGILATWAETYNHTLSEAWMTGVPVVATDLGALGERIAEHGGGFLVPPDDADEALRRILAMADDPAGLAAAAALSPRALRSVARMADDYDAVYADALRRRRAFATGRPLRVGLACLGTRAEAPGSVQVRMLRPLSHPTLRGDLTVHLTTADELQRDALDLDLVIVQRTALDPEDVDPTVAHLAAIGLPLVVEVDDLLFDLDRLPDGDEDWTPHVSGLQTLMRAADLVTVSTDPIAEDAAGVAQNVAVVANHLDERLWFADLELPDLSADPVAPVRLLYVGSRTHDADLALLRPVLDGVRTRLGRTVELDVVGGTADDADWFNRVPIPRGTANYPAFARWLASVAPGHVVALAPLVDTPFTRAKSDLKWLEYAAMGLPGVFSAHPAYDTSVVDGQTGLLAAEDPESWVDAIARLVEDPELAAAVVANARAEVLATRTLDRRVRERIDLYRTVVRAEVPA